MKTTLNVLFKKMQKDDKKEVLYFQVQGDELPHAERLVEMAGGFVILEVAGCEAGEVTAEFSTLQRDSKKTVLKFAIKGDSEDKAVKLYQHAGTNVTLFLEPAQMTLDEYYEDALDNDGIVDVLPGQMSLLEDDGKVVPLKSVGDDELPF